MADKKWFRAEVELSHIFACAVGYLYLTGYLINSIFCRNLGINRAEALKLQYIEIGLVFTLMTVSLTAIIPAAFYVTFRIRKSSQLPHYWAGGIGNALNTAHFCLVLIFTAIFITNYEWNYTIDRLLFRGWQIKDLFAIYMLSVFFAMAILPAVERIVVKKCSKRTMRIMFRSLIEPLRYCFIVFSLLYDVVLLTNIGWIPQLLARGFYYLLTALVFPVGTVLVLLWLRKVGDRRNSPVLVGIVCAAVVAVLYLSVNSYVYGVYRFVPMNRGGKLPLTETYLELPKEVTFSSFPVPDPTSKLVGPVYVVEETSEYLYVASGEMGQWTLDYLPVHAVKKQSVKHYMTKRIEDSRIRRSKDKKQKK